MRPRREARTSPARTDGPDRAASRKSPGPLARVRAIRRGQAVRAALPILGMHPIRRTSPDDLFVVGYPKSGNTWMQNLLAAAYFGIDPALTPDAIVQDLVPDVHHRRAYRRYADRMIFKSHALPWPEARSVIYLTRDPRDLLVSFSHHCAALGEKPIDAAAVAGSGHPRLPGTWKTHVAAWRENPYGASVLWLSYERLKADPFASLERVASFSQCSFDADRLRWACERSQLDRMRAKESRWGFEGWPREARFVRRGEVGSHRDELPPGVAEAVRHACEPEFTRLYPEASASSSLSARESTPDCGTAKSQLAAIDKASSEQATFDTKRHENATPAHAPSQDAPSQDATAQDATTLDARKRGGASEPRSSDRKNAEGRSAA